MQTNSKMTCALGSGLMVSVLATAPLIASAQTTSGAQNNGTGMANPSGTMSSDSGGTGAAYRKPFSPATGNKTANPNDPKTGNIGNAGGSTQGANSGGVGSGGTGGGTSGK
ncbi:hypothetical protein [Pararobbsia alpina]|uniref:Uncharacterized protein n=1 Tax=Pararobbsia alpina TaxID=621374 RepID=A0A6S7AYJ9_9BURK|nr:hypothetical protein [Pararobbsia alpina]CAB3781988.1 hypothetical protein LMG28138_01412 [Pararobbsia alpina]